MQNADKLAMYKQTNQIAEKYWDELCAAVNEVCANPTDDNIQRMESFKNRIARFYKAQNKKMEAFEDFENYDVSDSDSDIIDDIKSKISQDEIEKKISENKSKKHFVEPDIPPFEPYIAQ